MMFFPNSKYKNNFINSSKSMMFFPITNTGEGVLEQ